MSSGFTTRLAKTKISALTVPLQETVEVKMSQHIRDDVSGSDWTSGELEAITRDYLEMLQDELAGISYNKSEHRRQLMQIVNRTEGAIEFKHQNISAVLEEVGHPWIKGYKPAHNYQDALVEYVEQFISDKIDGLPLKEMTVVETNPSNLFVAPPRRNKKSLPKVTVRLARKIDQAKRDNSNRALGNDGEKFIFELEKQKLADLPHLSEKVRWESRDKGDGLGYDIYSFERDGGEIFIEVKTTCGGIETPFFITASELAVSKEKGDKYRLYRVFEYGPSPKIFKLYHSLEDHIHLDASVFKASF